MLLAHPRAIIGNWRELEPPERCRKSEEYHSKHFYEYVVYDRLYGQGSFSEQEKTALYERYKNEQRLGPCVSKLWDILPKDEAIEIFERPGELPLCLRRIGSTTYTYTPTGEKVTAWQPGFFLGLPITKIALVQFSDGSVNEKAREKLVAGREQNGSAALDFYATDR